MSRAPALSVIRMTQADHDDLIFITRAAEMLGIKTRALLTLIDEGQLPAYNLAGRIGIRRTDIEMLRGIDPDEA